MKKKNLPGFFAYSDVIARIMSYFTFYFFRKGALVASDVLSTHSLC